MKKIILGIITVYLSVSAFAQNTADIGIWIGGSSYWGDMTYVDYNSSINPFFGGYLRYNFNPRYSLRASYLAGKIGALGEMENVTWEFGPDGPKTVHDLSLQIEINYLKYLLGQKKTPITSYLLGGLGIMYYPYYLDPVAISGFNPDHIKGDVAIEEAVVTATLPFGMGVKMNVGKRMGIGAEVLFRKILDDKLDDLDDPLAHISTLGNEVSYNGTFHNNDYSVFFGLHITYMVYIGSKICPAYDSKD